MGSLAFSQAPTYMLPWTPWRMDWSPSRVINTCCGTSSKLSPWFFALKPESCNTLCGLSVKCAPFPWLSSGQAVLALCRWLASLEPGGPASHVLYFLCRWHSGTQTIMWCMPGCRTTKFPLVRMQSRWGSNGQDGYNFCVLTYSFQMLWLNGSCFCFLLLRFILVLRSSLHQEGSSSWVTTATWCNP